jgi:hypothetical protein
VYANRTSLQPPDASDLELVRLERETRNPDRILLEGRSGRRRQHVQQLAKALDSSVRLLRSNDRSRGE